MSSYLPRHARRTDSYENPIDRSIRLLVNLYISSHYEIVTNLYLLPSLRTKVTPISLKSAMDLSVILQVPPPLDPACESHSTVSRRRKITSSYSPGTSIHFKQTLTQITNCPSRAPPPVPPTSSTPSHPRHPHPQEELHPLMPPTKRDPSLNQPLAPQPRALNNRHDSNTHHSPPPLPDLPALQSQPKAHSSNHLSPRRRSLRR